jgi:putative hydrolase of the HAD superfamily
MTEDNCTIEAVIFDFGGVLCEHPDESWVEGIAYLLGTTASEVMRALWKNRVAYDAGQESEEYWSGVVDQLGKRWNRDQLPALIEAEVALWSHFDERMLGFAAHLQARGFSTAILSNLPRPLGEALRATPGFMDPFDHHTFSYELGIVKPDAAIFKHALKGIGAAPEQTLFLDDRKENIDGAKALGIQAELYNDWEDLTEVIVPRYGLPLPDVARRQ